MLTLKDCLDYCDLTEDEVSLFAEHEHLPDDAAAQIACGMVQTDQGVLVVSHALLEMAEQASARGELNKAEEAAHLCSRFIHDHPLHSAVH